MVVRIKQRKGKTIYATLCSRKSRVIMSKKSYAVGIDFGVDEMAV